MKHLLNSAVLNGGIYLAANSNHLFQFLLFKAGHDQLTATRRRAGCKQPYQVLLHRESWKWSSRLLKISPKKIM